MADQTPFEKRFPARMYPALSSQIPDTPGIYLISNFMESPPHNARGRDKILRRIKVGKAQKSLRRRLSSYLLYWPTGVVVYALVGTKTLAQATWLEVFLHNFLRLCGTRYRRPGKERLAQPKHSHLSEWFILDEIMVRNLVSTFFSGRGQHILSISKNIFGKRRLLPDKRLSTLFPMLSLYNNIDFKATDNTMRTLMKLSKPQTLDRVTKSWTVHVREPRLLKSMLSGDSKVSKLQIRPHGGTAVTETRINKNLQKALLDADRGWRHTFSDKKMNKKKLKF